MQGVGNDFVVLDAADIPDGADLGAIAIRLCARRFSIGADGLLVGRIDPDDPIPVSMRMFNPDGTEDMCGNGLRCIGLWALREGGACPCSPFLVRTREGIRTIRILEADDAATEASLTVDMGRPRFAPAEIPFTASPDARIVDYPLTVEDRTFRITAVNTGSTHTVIFGPPPPEDDFQKYSPLLENHPVFPERTSIMWATPRGEGRIEIRIWERGAGETLGCGTGACATGVAAQILGLTRPGETVHVASRGGTLSILWPGGDAQIEMTGPAKLVFTGDAALD